jgi:hypothetical protein
MHSRYSDEPDLNSAKSTPITTSAASHAPSLVFGAVLGVPLGAPEATGVPLGAPEATGVPLGAPEATVGRGAKVGVDVGACVALASGSTEEVQRVGAAFHAAIGAEFEAEISSSERARAAIGATRCILPLKSRMNSHTCCRSPLTEVSAQ